MKKIPPSGCGSRSRAEDARAIPTNSVSTAAFDAAEDVIIERDGAKLVVDKTSLDLLKGSEVDYGESLMEAGFKVINPNATSSCGCGSSFSVEIKPRYCFVPSFFAGVYE